MNTTDYENIWQKSLIHVTNEFTLPPVVLQAGEAIIGTLGNLLDNVQQLNIYCPDLIMGKRRGVLDAQKHR